MKPFLFLFAGLLMVLGSSAQSVPQKLAAAVTAFEADSQMRHAILGFCVVDSKTGKPVYEHNAQIGLAPASTQKLFTSAAAWELLGKEYRYKTILGYDGKVNKGVLKGNLYLLGSGDPTLGSWRWKETTDTIVLKELVTAIKKAGITQSIDGVITTNESGFPHQAIPDGWIWQDIGNYYGAGAYSLNWRENQYNLHLQSGSKPGDHVVILEDSDSMLPKRYVNELSSAPKGTGDNAYIYLGVEGYRHALVSGTIPVNEKSFSISGASADPVGELIIDLGLALSGFDVKVNASCEPVKNYSRDQEERGKIKTFYTHLSPPLDSINYWFLRRSINLYGEALVKTIALEKTGNATTDKGVELVRNFWKEQGIDKAAIHIIDGSGLSPQNRVTTDAMVKVLQYAKTRPWYSSFYYALPEYNGMKMKSGSIGGARAFGGYHTAKDGTEYTYAVIVNNYDGSSGEAVKKLYKVLDVLK